MKRTACFLYLMCSLVSTSIAQQGLSPAYLLLTKRADSLYNQKNYKGSALTYSDAFKANGWRALLSDRYNAACSWARAGVPDSAFSNLFKIAKKGNYADADHLLNDPDLSTLHDNVQWNELTSLVKMNKSHVEENYNQPLKKELEGVFVSDQYFRKKLDSIETKYGTQSKQFRAVLDSMKKTDAVNLQKITAILDKKGWLGPDEVGRKGNMAFFVVLIHADLKTMQRYLPVMQAAVQQNKATKANLAYLQDKIEIITDKRQTYGTQLDKDPQTNKFYVLPVKDRANLNKLRENMDLPPIEVAMKEFNISEIR